MGRLPELGKVKTRLAQTIGQEAALRLHAAFMEDTIRLACSAAAGLAGGAYMAYAGNGPPADRIASQISCFPQHQGDLGDRQAHAQEQLFSLGAGSVITLGTDSPTLPVGRITSAWQQRTTAELIIIPADDGGYILSLHSKARPAIYQDVPWGTANTLSTLCRRAQQAGVSVHHLEPWYDVDDHNDLMRLQDELHLAPETAPSSAQALRTL